MIGSENEVIVKLKARIPFKNYRVKKKCMGQGNMAQGLFGLTQNQLETVKIYVKKAKTNRSNIFRRALDAYRLMLNKEPEIQCVTGKKYPVRGLKIIATTIRKDQDEWLRQMVEKTGKKRSEIGREALEYYFEHYKWD